MAKKTLAKIFGVSEVPCVRTGKTDHVLDVSVGDYVYPLHITELWKEMDSAHCETSSGKTSDKSKSDLPPSGK